MVLIIEFFFWVFRRFYGRDLYRRFIDGDYGGGSFGFYVFG